MIEKRKWIAPMTYEMRGFPKVAFTGREPFPLPNEAHRNALVSTGVFRDTRGGGLWFSGRSRFPKADGAFWIVAEDGTIEFDRMTDPIIAAAIDKETEAI